MIDSSILAISIMATLMMTTDRLYGVYRPIRRRELIAGACYSNTLVLFVISLAILSGLPKFLMSTTFDIPNANRTVCISEDPAAKGTLSLNYSIFKRNPIRYSIGTEPKSELIFFL